MRLSTLTRNPRALAFYVGVVSSKFYSKITHERIARFTEVDPSTSGHVKGSQSNCGNCRQRSFFNLIAISHSGKSNLKGYDDESLFTRFQGMLLNVSSAFGAIDIESEEVVAPMDHGMMELNTILRCLFPRSWN